MKEINLVELTEWFDNKTRKKIEPLKREAEKKISKCESIFDELKIECKALEEHSPTTSEELIIKSVKRFSTKVVEKLDNIEFPEKITYKEVDNFKDRLEKFLETIFDYGKRWVSKISLDKTYLQNIRKINYLLKDIQNLYRKLISFLENKYRKAKNVEFVESLIIKITELKEEAKAIKITESEIENQLKKNEIELNQLNEKIQTLEKDEIINQLSIIDKEMAKINGKIRNLIGPIRKPLKKFSKLIDDGDFIPNPDSVTYITNYLNDPLKSFLSDNEFIHLNSIFLDLKEAINSNKLKLKTSAQKKIINKINQTNKNDLIAIKTQLEQFDIQKQKILLNPIYKEKILNLKDLREKKDNLKREVEGIEVQLEKNTEDYNRILNKLGENKTKIETSIYEITDTEIKLIL